MHTLYAALFFLVGLVLGSFAGCLAWRVPQGISPLKGRSRCPACRKPLSWRSLVPVLSWLFQKGRCRECGASLPADYPLIETGCALAALAVYAARGLGSDSFFLMPLIPVLAALAAIDLRLMLLPNPLVFAVGVLGVARFAILDLEALPAHLIAGLLYGGGAWLLGVAMEKFLKKPALGLGDVKFMGAAGLWLGPLLFPSFLILSGVSGIVLGMIWKVRGHGLFPFGPALIAALFVLLLKPDLIPGF